LREHAVLEETGVRPVVHADADLVPAFGVQPQRQWWCLSVGKGEEHHSTAGVYLIIDGDPGAVGTVAGYRLSGRAFGKVG